MRVCLLAPVDDYLAALAIVLDDHQAQRVMLMVVAAVLSWWVYVPIHELSHVLGCVLGGGTVTRLEIDPLYGAALLARVFPFVVSGSEYAGRLSGFDTGGSDLTYLLTDALPYLWTVLIGVPLLRSVRHGSARGSAGAVRLGLALPVAFAPLISLAGDYYEMGSIIVSRAVATAAPGFDLSHWRSDDLVVLTRHLLTPTTQGTWADLAGVAISALLGLVLSLSTYWLGRLCSDLIPPPANKPRIANHVRPVKK